MSRPRLPLPSVRLREHRARTGYSLRELGQRAGLAWTTVHRIERYGARATLPTLEALARALGVTLTDLVA